MSSSQRTKNRHGDTSEAQEAECVIRKCGGACLGVIEYALILL